MPIDDTLETRQKVPFATKISKYFDSEIHVVPVYSTTIKAVTQKIDNYTAQVVKYLEEENVKHIAKAVDADNVTNATINYAKTIDADMIAIMTEQEMTTSNLFLGAFAQQMVNHSPIPVLNIHAKEYIKISSR